MISPLKIKQQNEKYFAWCDTQAVTHLSNVGRCPRPGGCRLAWSHPPESPAPAPTRSPPRSRAPARPAAPGPGSRSPGAAPRPRPRAAPPAWRRPPSPRPTVLSSWLLLTALLRSSSSHTRHWTRLWVRLIWLAASLSWWLSSATCLLSSLALQPSTSFRSHTDL